MREGAARQMLPLENVQLKLIHMMILSQKFATVTLLTTAIKIFAKPEIMSIQHRARELALLSPAVLLCSFQLFFCCCFWISFIHNCMI